MINYGYPIISFSHTIILYLEYFNNNEPEEVNILFIVSDYHTSQEWGFYGRFLNDFLHIPDISLLANEGYFFENSLFSNSIGTLNRVTILADRIQPCEWS